MPTVKRIICLANSRKRGGRCVAGKERLNDGQLAWVRPVSGRPDEEVPEQEYRYADGTCPQVLDVIDVPLQGVHPSGFQSENWLLQPGQRWVHVRRAEWRHLARLADDPPGLWENGSSSSDGLDDRVAVADTAQLHCSLFLLHVDDLALCVSVPKNVFGGLEPRVQAGFSWRGKDYRLRVTDPAIEATYLLRPDGTYPIGECYATVSLGMPYHGFCYKLVAAIMLPGRPSA